MNKKIKTLTISIALISLLCACANTETPVTEPETTPVVTETKEETPAVDEITAEEPKAEEQTEAPKQEEVAQEPEKTEETVEEETVDSEAVIQEAVDAYEKLLDDKENVDENEVKEVEGKLEQAAELGDAKSYYRIGNIYGNILKDDATAEEWYNKGVENNDVSSMVRLGFFYAAGQGGKTVNEDKALEYYEMAAENGDVESMADVAQYYLKRTDEADWEQAYYWLEKYITTASTTDGDHYSADGIKYLFSQYKSEFESIGKWEDVQALMEKINW